MPHEIALAPIATVISDRVEPSDDFWGDTQAVIRLHPDIPQETLQGLDEFSHLQVVWRFHKATPNDIHLGTRHPRGNTTWPATGTFAHRNHRRPAQIGISHPRLIRIDAHDLHVQDLDAIDGTPVLDIAPWFNEFGPQGPIEQPAWPTEMLTDYWSR